MKIMMIVLLLASASMVGIVYGHSDAEGVVKERMDAMTDMSDNSKRVGGMFKGKTAFNKQTLANAANVYAQHGKQMVELFPNTEESRTGSNTEALPKIWEDWGEFNERAVEFVELSELLKKTVSETDDVKELEKAFFKVAKSCSGCHKRFRKPK